MYTSEEITLFRTFIHEELGIAFPDSKDYLVESKLRKTLSLTGRRNVRELMSDMDQKTRRLVAQSVTTNHTFFFREAEHFDFLAKDLVSRQVRSPSIWCAAASSGEEPYSIAITLFEAGVDQFRILASDVDREMLENIHHGVYAQTRLAQVSATRLKRYFIEEKGTAEPRNFRVIPGLRNHLAVKELNLLARHKLAVPADAIFLRNVLIYFDRATQVQVIEQVTENLAPGGLFFLGHSESLAVLQTGTELFHVGPSIYRKKVGQK